MSDIIARLLDDTGFMPHGMCLLWRWDLLSLHVVSDGLISLSYFSIPLFLFVFAKKRRDLAFRPMFYMFSAFILLCGLTHLVGIVTFWEPIYLEAGVVKLATAIVSASTAVLIWKAMPDLLAIPSNSLLRETNARMEHEIRERNRAQSELSRSNALLQDAISNMSDGFALYDSNERLVTSNLVYKRLLDRCPRLVPGATFEEIFRGAVQAGQFKLPESMAEAWVRSRLQAVRGGAGEQEQELSDGRWVLMKERRTADGGTVSIFTDITQQKRSEITLRESEERFRGAFETAPHGMALVAPDGRWLKVNGALCAILGYSEQELLALDAQEAGHPDDRAGVRAHLDDLLAGRSVSHQNERRYLDRNGHVVWMLTSASLIRDAQGEPLYFVQQMIDLTEHKETAAKLLQSQKMEAVGQLTGGIAHDFNNLLTIILGNARILERRLSDNEAVVVYFPAFSEAVRRGANLTKRLLTFSRKQDLRAGPVDARELVDSLLELLRRTLGETIAVDTRYGEGDFVMQTDANLLEAAILNLATNARDAMPRGGALTIALEDAPARAVEDGAAPAAGKRDYVMLSVSDTGAGIPEEAIDRIFEPFFTTKEVGKGTGLGLSQVFGFVEQSGGFIQVASEPGQGARFRLFLPRAAAAIEPAPDDPVESEAEGGAKGTILVVEDEPRVRQVAVAIVEDLGYRVVQAENGPDALAYLERSPDVDLLFTDIVMPGGMTGYQLAEQARKRWPSLKVLFTSGYADEATRAGVKEADAKTLRKPYRDTELAARIREALASGS